MWNQGSGLQLFKCGAQLEADRNSTCGHLLLSLAELLVFYFLPVLTAHHGQTLRFFQRNSDTHLWEYRLPIWIKWLNSTLPGLISSFYKLIYKPRPISVWRVHDAVSPLLHLPPAEHRIPLQLRGRPRRNEEKEIQEPVSIPTRLRFVVPPCADSGVLKCDSVIMVRGKERDGEEV